MKCEVLQRVRYHETDVGGSASERAFIYWMDSVRNEFLRRFPKLTDALKDGKVSLRTLNIMFQITDENYCDYDDLILITAEAEIYDNGTVRFEYTLSDENGNKIATGMSVHALYENGVILKKKDFEKEYLAKE